MMLFMLNALNPQARRALASLYISVHLPFPRSSPESHPLDPAPQLPPKPLPPYQLTIAQPSPSSPPPHHHLMTRAVRFYPQNHSLAYSGSCSAASPPAHLGLYSSSPDTPACSSLSDQKRGLTCRFRHRRVLPIDCRFLPRPG